MLDLRISKGNLLEESHYYPHGLPIAGMGSAADGFKENRRRYQGNEYIKDQGLHWMGFQARQYDPQTGRFLGVDPLGDAYGQQVWSPYAAMGNAPESQVDPNGTASSNYMSAYMPDYQQIMGSARYFEGMMPTASSHLPGGALWGGRKGPFEGISWAGMSGAVLANYLDGAGADLKSIILSITQMISGRNSSILGLIKLIMKEDLKIGQNNFIIL